MDRQNGGLTGTSTRRVNILVVSREGWNGREHGSAAVGIHSSIPTEQPVRYLQHRDRLSSPSPCGVSQEARKQLVQTPKEQYISSRLCTAQFASRANICNFSLVLNGISGCLLVAEDPSESR